MRFSTALFTVALAAIASANPLARRDAATIEADLAVIATDLTNLNTAINAFNATPKLLQALTIHTKATALNTAIVQANTDTVATSALGEDDATTILAAVQGLVTLIQTALTNIVAESAQFQALPIGGIPALVKSDLSTLSNSTQTLEASLVAITPADLLDQANAVVASINDAFAAAIAALT